MHGVGGAEGAGAAARPGEACRAEKFCFFNFEFVCSDSVVKFTRRETDFG